MRVAQTIAIYGGKSEQYRTVCQLTAGHREVTESATENKPLTDMCLGTYKEQG